MYFLNERITKNIDKHFEACKEIADYLTDNPETGGNEKKASFRITSFLKEKGYRIKMPIENIPYSFLANKYSKEDTRPKIAIMCEYDALPDIGHACGHSLSCGSSLLAALALEEFFNELPFRIDVVGTPAEEYPGGKVFLSEKGFFDDYEFAIMAHMFYKNSPVFKVLACSDRYITFKGKNSHASANPCDGINALNAARIFMDSIDLWRQHIPSTSQIHGIIESGGELPSIVPDRIELNYYFRAKNMVELEDLVEKADKCAKGAALCTGTTYDIKQRYPTYSDIYLNPIAMKTVEEIFYAMGEKSIVFENPQGSTDAGNVDQVIPVFHPLVEITDGEEVPLHDAKFERLMKSNSGYKGMYNGGVLIASIILRMATEPELLKEIQLTHKNYREKNKVNIKSFSGEYIT